MKAITRALFILFLTFAVLFGTASCSLFAKNMSADLTVKTLESEE